MLFSEQCSMKRKETHMPETTCPQRDVQLEQYREAVRAYSEAVLGLDADLTTQEFDSAQCRKSTGGIRPNTQRTERP